MLWEGFLLTQTRGKWAILVGVNKGETVEQQLMGLSGEWSAVPSFWVGVQAVTRACDSVAGMPAHPSWTLAAHCPSTSLNPVPYAWHCVHLKLVLAGKPVLVCIHMLGRGESNTSFRFRLCGLTSPRKKYFLWQISSEMHFYGNYYGTWCSLGHY